MRKLFKAFRIPLILWARMRVCGVDCTYFLLCKMKRSLDVLSTLLALLIGIVLEFDHLVEIVGAALFLDVLLNELGEPQLTYPQRVIGMEKRAATFIHSN